MSAHRTLRGDITALRRRYAEFINALVAGASFAFCAIGIVMFFTTLSTLY